LFRPRAASPASDFAAAIGVLFFFLLAVTLTILVYNTGRPGEAGGEVYNNRFPYAS
jgi:cbb3-type cytochrome oxidase subunit 3